MVNDVWKIETGIEIDCQSERQMYGTPWKQWSGPLSAHKVKNDKQETKIIFINEKKSSSTAHNFFSELNRVIHLAKIY